MLRQIYKTIFRETDQQSAEPKLYVNCKGKQLHMLDCECGGCTIKPRHYRRALQTL
jgi:hypothetical protein